MLTANLPYFSCKVPRVYTGFLMHEVPITAAGLGVTERFLTVRLIAGKFFETETETCVCAHFDAYRMEKSDAMKRDKKLSATAETARVGGHSLRHSWSFNFKVTDFGTYRKPLCDILLVTNIHLIIVTL